MKKINVAVFENNEELLNELTSYISSVEGYEVCAASANGNAAAELIKRNVPFVRFLWRLRQAFFQTAKLTYSASTSRLSKIRRF